MTQRKTLLAGLLMSATMTAEAQRADIVYVTPGLGEERCTSTLAPIVDDFFATATRREQQVFVDASQLSQITVLSVPDTKVYDNPNPRRVRRKNGTGISDILRFCARTEAASASTLYYQTLRSVGNNIPVSPDQKNSNVLMIAYPVTIDPQSSTTAMTGARRPNDAHHRASRFITPFGTAGEDTLLEGVRVHIAIPDEEWVKNPTHKAEVERVFAYQVKKRGGELGSYEFDLPTVLSRIRNGQTHRLPYRPLTLTDSKLAMVDHSQPHTGNDIFDRPLSNTTPTEDILTSELSDVSIGLSWSCACDVDLLTTPRPEAPPLYYANVETLDGRFLKDYRNPNAERGFETVEFSRPVSLSNIMIAANLYAGEAPDGVSGKVRVAIGNETFESTFELHVTSGNSGHGANSIVANRASPNDHWVLIDPLDVVRGR